MQKIPTFDDVKAAHLTLAGDVVRTPLLRCEQLDKIAQREVWVKAECLQWAGSFKYRGARNRILALSDRECKKGVVAFSSGNHAQGVALAAKRRGVKCVIVMPSDTPKIKIAGVKSHGGEVQFYNRLHEDREQIAAKISAKNGAIIIPPYDDSYVIAGQGTVGLEISEQIKSNNTKLQAIIVNAGGGGLTAGIALVLEKKMPEVKLYTCEPEGFDDHKRSFASGFREQNRSLAGSICDSLMTQKPGDLTFEINQKFVAGGVTVSDEQVIAAMRFAFLHLKLVLEPGGAAGLAGVLCGKVSGNGPVCVIVTGGNVDPAFFIQVLAG